MDGEDVKCVDVDRGVYSCVLGVEGVAEKKDDMAVYSLGVGVCEESVDVLLCERVGRGGGVGGG